MPENLTKYEAREVRRISVWKAELPSRISGPFRALRKPLNKVMGRVVPGSIMRSCCEQIDSFVQPGAGREEIARAAGVADVSELAHHSLEECDQLALSVSVRAQRIAILESGAAGTAGIVGEALYVPVLLGAAIRAIRRIGNCYGYTLDSKLDQQYVVGILELAAADEPERRQQTRARLYRLMHEQNAPPIELDGVREEMTEDLVIGSVPILGNLASLVLDYAFMRRVDDSARRVFQERWLRRRGKVTVIPPAEVSTRSQSLSVIWEATREILYLGSYGVGFVATLPVVATAQVARFLLPEPVVRGGADGARDAVAAGDRLHQGAHATGPLPASVSPRPAGAPA